MILIKKRCIFFVTFLILCVYVCVLVCVRSLIVWQILDVKFVFNVRKSMENPQKIKKLLFFILRLRSCLLSCSDLNLRLNRIKMKFLIEKKCVRWSVFLHTPDCQKKRPQAFSLNSGQFLKCWMEQRLNQKLVIILILIPLPGSTIVLDDHFNSMST